MEGGVAGTVLNRSRLFESLRGVLDPGLVVHLRRMLARVPHSSLLDLGCGTGNLCGMTDAAYLGVDSSPSYIRYAREHYASASASASKRFEVADAFALDGSVGCHDVAALINFVHHFSDEDVLRILRGLRAATPRHVFLVDVDMEKTTALFRLVFMPLDRGRHFRTRGAQRSLLEKAGCRVEWEDGCTSWPGIYPHSAIMAAYPEAGGG